MNEKNVNWDKELESLNETLTNNEQGQAQFEVISTKMRAVMKDWMSTKVYARVNQEGVEYDQPYSNDEGIVEVSTDEFEDSVEAELGQIACVPVMGLIGQILSEIMAADAVFEEEQIERFGEAVTQVVGNLLVEGILISNAPEWREKFDEAMTGIRELGDLGTII
jgi:hypothetical protein